MSYMTSEVHAQSFVCHLDLFEIIADQTPEQPSDTNPHATHADLTETPQAHMMQGVYSPDDLYMGQMHIASSTYTTQAELDSFYFAQNEGQDFLQENSLSTNHAAGPSSASISETVSSGVTASPFFLVLKATCFALMVNSPPQLRSCRPNPNRGTGGIHVRASQPGGLQRALAFTFYLFGRFVCDLLCFLVADSPDYRIYPCGVKAPTT